MPFNNHFIFSYRGNKRCECDEIFKVIEPHLEDIDTIIEPFCGSSAFSYFMSLKYPLKYKYILNDYDINLINLYELLKDDEKTKQLIQDLKVMNVGMNKEKYKEVYEKRDDDMVSYVYTSLIYVLRPGLFPYDLDRVQKKNFDKLLERGILNFLRTENIEVKYGDGVDVIDKYKNDSNVLFLIDPPYLMTCNSFYDMSAIDSKKINVYQYLSENQIGTFNAYTCLILEKNWIINLLFNKDIKSTHGKMYQGSKKKTEHLIIDNRNITSMEI